MLTVIPMNTRFLQVSWTVLLELGLACPRGKLYRHGTRRDL